MSADKIAQAAIQIGCEPAALRAIWEVESSGRGFRRDGSLERRFEPHKMPETQTTWRDSLQISAKDRDRLLCEAYDRHPNAALSATSWGGAQIMGFNAREAGFSDPLCMVEAMAESEDGHVDAFVALIQAWGIDSAVREHDWLTFARRYNGTGQPETYALRIETAYRQHSGRSSPTVLRVGSRGEGVRRIQKALEIEEDGAFGDETLKAVVEFQQSAGLNADGVVGRLTWEAIQAATSIRPVRKAHTTDRMVEVGGLVGGPAAVVLGLVEPARDLFPAGAFAIGTYGIVALGLIIGGAYAWRIIHGEPG